MKLRALTILAAMSLSFWAGEAQAHGPSPELIAMALSFTLGLALVASYLGWMAKVWIYGKWGAWGHSDVCAEAVILLGSFSLAWVVSYLSPWRDGPLTWVLVVASILSSLSARFLQFRFLARIRSTLEEGSCCKPRSEPVFLLGLISPGIFVLLLLMVTPLFDG